MIQYSHHPPSSNSTCNLSEWVKAAQIAHYIGHLDTFSDFKQVVLPCIVFSMLWVPDYLWKSHMARTEGCNIYPPITEMVMFCFHCTKAVYRKHIISLSKARVLSCSHIHMKYETVMHQSHDRISLKRLNACYIRLMVVFCFHCTILQLYLMLFCFQFLWAVLSILMGSMWHCMFSSTYTRI